jgi:hypothetical protein
MAIFKIQLAQLRSLNLVIKNYHSSLNAVFYHEAHHVGAKDAKGM